MPIKFSSRAAALVLLASTVAALPGCVGQLSPASAVGAPRRADFQAQLSAFIDRLNADPNAPPGTVVVVVQDDSTIFSLAHGLRNVATRAPMTLDTPVYTGSSTKSYIGLLAAELDRKGLLPLGTRLTDIWPDLKLKPPLDASTVTAAQLLSHSAPIIDTGLVFQSNVTGEYNLDKVPQHLARYAEPQGKPFQYSNFGPFLYSMMVEKKLGKGWRDVLAEHVLEPLELRRTSARLEDFGPDELARCHTRAAPDAAWEAVPPKPTSLLNAAGGLYASARDAAAYLKAFTSVGRSAGARIPAPSFRRTSQTVSNQDQSTWGFHRHHYGLGWDIATYGDKQVLLRAGVYTGCRAMYVVYPEAQLAIGVLTASDVAGHIYNASIVQQAIDLWAQDPTAGANADRRAVEFSKQAAAAVAKLQSVRAAAPKPAPVRNIGAYQGRYSNDRLGIFTITAEGSTLRARMGEYKLTLVPVGDDKFLAYAPADPQPETFTFEQGSRGRLHRMMWGERPFERLP